jgi:hypothetical protein
VKRAFFAGNSLYYQPSILIYEDAQKVFSVEIKLFAEAREQATA